MGVSFSSGVHGALFFLEAFIIGQGAWHWHGKVGNVMVGVWFYYWDVLVVCTARRRDTGLDQQHAPRVFSFIL